MTLVVPLSGTSSRVLGFNILRVWQVYTLLVIRVPSPWTTRGGVGR